MVKHSPHYWLAEPLLELDSHIERRMFGSDAIYAYGRLQIVLCTGNEEPWTGILIPTDKTRQPELIKQFPLLSAHSVLGKWLYLSAENDEFERIAQTIVSLILQNDARIGVEPSRAKKKSGKRNKSKTRKK